MPLEISNLGPEASRDYAQRQEQLDPSLISDARGIPSQTETSVLKPSHMGEIEALLNTQPTTTPWASIPAPVGFYEQRGLAPFFASIASENKLGALIDKVANTPSPSSSPLDAERHSKEQEVLTSSLNQAVERGKLNLEINGRMHQYSKG